jgi:hypothetical protein
LQKGRDMSIISAINNRAKAQKHWFDSQSLTSQSLNNCSNFLLRVCTLSDSMSNSNDKLLWVRKMKPNLA